MKPTKLTALRVKTFITDLSVNKKNQALTIKGGFHDGPTGCICTAGINCELNPNP